MSKLAQFTDVHFPGLTPNSYDNLNSIKLDLNVPTRSVNFSANNEVLQLQFTNQGDYKFLPIVQLLFFKGHSPGHLQKWNLLHASQTIHCVKSVLIRSYFWSVFSCIQSEYRKIRTRNNSVFGHFSRSDSYCQLATYLLVTLLIYSIYYQKSDRP